MPEDSELSRRRIEHQELRKQLNEVFGPFEQFCEYVAGATSAGSSGIMRHGVVQIPTTSAVLSARSVLPTSGPTTVTATQHSTQQLLQSMQNLVTSPIQPLQGLSFSLSRTYPSSAPSSSTQSATEISNNAAKCKRYKMPESDTTATEVDREKRRRRNEDITGIPSHSRSNIHLSSNPDSSGAVLRDGAERKEPVDKGVSPDSGVHSTENDPGDDNDMHSAQTIINLITKLSPPLSPIKLRPTDKKAERERKEIEIKERQRKEHHELEIREEERERFEKEQRERDERLKSERLEYEKRERDREEKLRRDRERQEKERRDKEQEKKEREEKDKKEKEHESKIKQGRENEEKLREKKEYQEQLRKEKEREVRKQRLVEQLSGEKKSKDSGRRDGHEKFENVKTGSGERMKLKESDQGLGERISRLDGEILLKGLDQLRLSQLIEIGRKMGRMKEERNENRREKTENVERRKEKKEREKWFNNKQGVEELDVHRRENESSGRSTPCIRPASSSQSLHRTSSTLSCHRLGFECAALESAPTKPVRPVKPKEDSTEMLYDFYQSVAKSQKRKGDAETDRINKVLFYLDTAVYFILSARHVSSDSPENRGNRQYSIIRDTNDLLKRVTQAFSPPSEGCSPWHLHMFSRVRNLSSRCQSTLLYHLYNLRSQNAIKSYNMLAHMDAQIQEEQQQQNGSAANNSSPASSVHSNSNQPTTVVTMPSKVYDLQRQQLKTLHHLMWSHRIWQDAAKRADVSNTDMAFISGLEKVCGQLFLDAPLEKMCAYMLTGIAWLRAEYELEKARPPPYIAKRIVPV